MFLLAGTGTGSPAEPSAGRGAAGPAGTGDTPGPARRDARWSLGQALTEGRVLSERCLHDLGSDVPRDTTAKTPTMENAGDR